MSVQRSIVSVVRSDYRTAAENIARGIELCGYSGIKNGGRIAIKVNMCDVRPPEVGATTHPEFLDAMLKWLRTGYQDLKIAVVESDATVTMADDFVRWLGLMPVIKKWNAEWVNLSKQPIVKKPIKGRFLKEVPVPRILEDICFITQPKPKTNLMTTITCCLKNQFGCLPDAEKGVFHPHIDDVIADVNLAMRPDLCIVDGIITQGGVHGPAFGVPVFMNAVICGTDPVATDAYCARIMGFRPGAIAHIRNAAKSGVGSMKYEFKGDHCLADFEIDWQAKAEMALLKIGISLQARAQKKFRTLWRSS